jgi:hypothetical protein
MQTIRLERDCLQPTQSHFSIARRYRSGAQDAFGICLPKLPVFAEPRLLTIRLTRHSRAPGQFRSEPGGLLRMGRALLSDGFAVFVCRLHTAKPEMICPRGNLAFAARTDYVTRAILVGTQE